MLSNMKETLPASRSGNACELPLYGTGSGAYALQQQHGLQVREGSVALRRIVDLAVVGLDPGDKLGQVLRRDRRMDVQNVWCVGKQRDRLEIAGDVASRRSVKMPGDDLVGERREEQVVAVGGSFGAGLHTDHATRTGPILDVDLLTEPRAEPLRDRTREDVGRTRRRESDDHVERLARVRLRHGTPGERKGAEPRAQSTTPDDAQGVATSEH